MLHNEYYGGFSWECCVNAIPDWSPVRLLPMCYYSLVKYLINGTVAYEVRLHFGDRNVHTHGILCTSAKL